MLLDYDDLDELCPICGKELECGSPCYAALCENNHTEEEE